jgi:hypothetical protein
VVRSRGVVKVTTINLREELAAKDFNTSMGDEGQRETLKRNGEMCRSAGRRCLEENPGMMVFRGKNTPEFYFQFRKADYFCQCARMISPSKTPLGVKWPFFGTCERGCLPINARRRVRFDGPVPRRVPRVCDLVAILVSP